MPVTRSDLRKQYENNHKSAMEGLINSTFNQICDEITISNSYGKTMHKVDLTYRVHWTQTLVDRVVEILKTYYSDTHIYTCDKVIYINWTFADHFADSSDTENVVEASSSSVPANDILNLKGDEDIQINISFPSRVTRSSSRK